MKIYIEPSFSGNIISTIAIGSNYLEAWEKCALPGWRKYCNRYNLGLVVFEEEIIEKNSKNWKKANWQKLLIGHELKKAFKIVKNVCYLDTDILISPLAPNVFETYDEEKIALVSQVNGLPQPLHQTLRRLAFLRNTHWDKKYPLDSSLFMTPSQIFDFHGMPSYDEYVCTGFFIFNVQNHSELFKGWFEKYQKGIQSITGGGEEPYLNYEFLSWGKITWMPYEFQALWIYEVSWRYPFLFAYGREDTNLIRSCIEASLYSNHFLHFAGSWYECDMWKVGGFFEDKVVRRNLEAYRDYLQMPVYGMPQGIVRP